jgi:hypothetical protein
MERAGTQKTVIVATLTLALLGALLFLSYEPYPGEASNPWGGSALTLPPEVKVSSSYVRIWVDNEQWMSCSCDEPTKVSDVIDYLLDTFPKLAARAPHPHPIRVTRWTTFDVRRIGPNLHEFLQPLLNNKWWSVPDSIDLLFGEPLLYDENYHVLSAEESKLPSLRLTAGDSVYLVSE